MMNALPESENMEVLVAHERDAGVGGRLTPQDFGRALQLRGRRLGQRRGGRPQQLTQREHGCQQRDGHQRAQRPRRMAIELELPPQLLRVVDVAVDEEQPGR